MMNHFKYLPALVLAFAGSALWAADPVATVEMNNGLSYEPSSISIQAGETVKFVNTSALEHTVTADPDKAKRAGNVALPAGAETFDSGTLAPNETFTHTFTVPGEYMYFCIPHELAGMTGTITVK
jgi:plastocyanin